MQPCQMSRPAPTEKQVYVCMTVTQLHSPRGQHEEGRVPKANAIIMKYCQRGIEHHHMKDTLRYRQDTEVRFVCFAAISRKGGDEVRVTATYLVFVATADRPRPSQIVIAVLNA